MTRTLSGSYGANEVDLLRERNVSVMEKMEKIQRENIQLKLELKNEVNQTRALRREVSRLLHPSNGQRRPND